MRSLWSGNISFGLVSIPVRLYVAAEEHGVDLNMLHKTDLSPIRYVRVCRAEGREVPYEDIVKGYEYTKGDFVVLTEEELRRASAKRSNTIDVVKFADEGEIPPIYFEKPYYLEPEDGAEKAYALLREALRRTKKVGVAKFVFKSKEHLAVVKPQQNVLLLNTLRYQSDIREFKELKLPDAAAARGRELEMAIQLIGQLSEPFHPEAFQDTYVAEVKRIAEQKAKGRSVPEGRAPAPTRVEDLMAALKASLAKSKEKANLGH